MAREDGKGLRLLFGTDNEGQMAKSYFDKEDHQKNLIDSLASMTGKQLEIETGTIQKEERMTKRLIRPMKTISQMKTAADGLFFGLPDAGSFLSLIIMLSC